MKTIAELKQKLSMLDTYILQRRREIDECNFRLVEMLQEREDIAAEIDKLKGEERCE